MNEHEIRELLTVIVAYDNRTIGPQTILAWSEQARRGRWDRDEAINAAHQHFSESPEWITPAHVNRIIRRVRGSAHPPPARKLLEQSRHDGQSWLHGGDDAAEGAANEPELESLHTEAMQVTCPRCAMRPGQRCRNRATRNAAKVPHTARSQRARDALDAAGVPSAFRHPDTPPGRLPPAQNATSPSESDTRGHNPHGGGMTPDAA